MANQAFRNIEEIVADGTTEERRVALTSGFGVKPACYIQLCKDYMDCYKALDEYIKQLEQYCEENRWDAGICLIDGYTPCEEGSYRINPNNLIQELKNIREDMLRPNSLVPSDLKNSIAEIKANVTNTTKSYMERPEVHKHKSWFLRLLDKFLMAITGRRENEHVIQPAPYKAIHNATKSLGEVHHTLFHPPEKEHRESDFYAPPAKGM